VEKGSTGHVIDITVVASEVVDISCNRRQSCLTNGSEIDQKSSIIWSNFAELAGNIAEIGCNLIQ
jgi:hypothetical protein